MRLYLAGPMSGIPDFNFPAFMAAAADLRSRGMDVVNPAEITAGSTDWCECMRKDIAALVTCEAVAVLPGWGRSRGAALEVHIAVALNMPVLDAATLEAVR